MPSRTLDSGGLVARQNLPFSALVRSIANKLPPEPRKKKEKKERVWTSKWSKELILDVRTRFETGQSMRAIADAVGLKYSQVYTLCQYTNHRDLIPQIQK